MRKREGEPPLSVFVYRFLILLLELILRAKMEIFLMDFVLLEKLMRLALRPQWVVRCGKVPFSPLPPYLVAKSNEPETWGFLGDALDAFRTGIFDGVGFEFGNFPSGTERVSGIDLDHVIREDGTLEPFAAEIVERVNS